MQVEWYRSFTEAAKWRSLSKAADKLNLTQPALSKHIRHLETAYGVELFRRGATGVELTEAGKLFLARITPIVDALASIEAELRPYAEQPGYVLGSLPSVAAHVLPARLREHHDAGYPITVHVRPTSGELLEGLHDGSFDAVLVDGGYADNRLWIRELFSEAYIAVLPAGHKLHNRTTLTVADLADEPFVFIACCDTRERFTTIAEQCGYRPDVKLEVSSNDYLLGIVAIGTGITVLPELFHTQAERLGLHTIPLAERHLRRTIALAARNANTGAKLYRMLNGGRTQQPEAAQLQ